MVRRSERPEFAPCEPGAGPLIVAGEVDVLPAERGEEFEQVRAFEQRFLRRSPGYPAGYPPIYSARLRVGCRRDVREEGKAQRSKRKGA